MSSVAEHHASLKYAPSNFVAGEAVALRGSTIQSHNPAHPKRIVWTGSGSVEAVADAVAAARRALPEWSAWSIEKRGEVLRAFQSMCREREQQIAELICDETGKALWDSVSEAKLLAGKVDVTLAEGANTGRSRVTGYDVAVSETQQGLCFFKPHGVMAVVGPFNFPAHLPNGHIVPALLMGNTIVFKPSDKTPAVGQMLAELFLEALETLGAPKGVFNLVQGRADVASALVSHKDVDGVLFTGSWPVGRRILEANLDQPGKIVALEMGGNNPAVVMPDCDLRQAVIECARASFVTTGQRCTCTRRIIVHEAIAEKFIELLEKATTHLIVGDPRGIGAGSRNQPVFMGPIIRAEARDEVLLSQKEMVKGGGRIVLESKAMEHPSGGHYITPGIVEVSGFSKAEGFARDGGCDEEVFGPLVRIARISSLDEAIEQANATRFGLAASIFTADESSAARFWRECRAGCINWNTGTAGASGKLPFGGLGLSGNHRPAGAFSLDYCAYPVASMRVNDTSASLLPGMVFEDGWMG